MILPCRLTKTLVHLWCSARAICAEIEQHRPDVIVALYHGVRPLLHAVQAMWAETHDAGSPFPPVAATNFGTEKHGRYTPAPKRLNAKYFIGLYESPLDRGHYLAWLTEQEDWLATLKDQIEAVLGQTPPERIMVLDDMTYEGNSSLSVLGLLRELYPRADLKYTEGFASGWLVDFAYFWLATNHPDIVPRMEKDWPRMVKASGHSHFERFLRRLTLGTEDVAPESLDWQPIWPGSATLAYISSYLPGETWLEIPGWFYRTLEANVRRWTRAGRPPSRFKCSERPEQDVGLKPADLIARELWLRRRVGVADAAAMTGISDAEAERTLSGFLQPGFIELRHDNLEEVYEMRNEVAILAYGSLQADPGWEIAPLIEHRIVDVLTPFGVEFARSSRSRGGAPTLVPVPDGQGGRVRAQLLLLKPDADVRIARNLLYRREIHKVGDTEVVYDEAVQSGRRGAVLVRELQDFAGIPVVLYTELNPNIPVVRTKKPPEVKAQELAERAVKSITQETYAAGTDGIRYLADAIENRIETPLTARYRAAVLALAGDAPDLETARTRIARERGIG
jgi:hypothetical protein